MTGEIHTVMLNALILIIQLSKFFLNLHEIEKVKQWVTKCSGAEDGWQANFKSSKNAATSNALADGKCTLW